MTISDQFINTFAKYYYSEDIYLNEQEKAKRVYFLSDWGISSLNFTEHKVEEKTMTLLTSGIYCEKALAWKAGKIKSWNDEEPIYTEEFKDNMGYSIGQNGNRAPIGQFEDYVKHINNNREDIINSIKKENFGEAYKTALSKTKEGKKTKTKTPDNFGPVNIINSLFFISSGKAPIYDKFAHKAIRALAVDFAPNMIYMGINPNKVEVGDCITMYTEYIELLKLVFPTLIGKGENGAFIPRDLDRALWVYGHCNKKWSPNA